ncbi:arsenite methyltransferase [uncultured Paenibacillus sp.]|uniref:arsenite methyltransferase n=1 Tax=uncultured Paenibacillus sp. TaxID=227322 RepID=UPI0015B08A48|nr:arsenite methyltransferase [uncultured Paenibacillus sp.]
MSKINPDEIRQNVRQRYRQIAVQSGSQPNATESSCCSPNNVGCCNSSTDFKEISAGLGYSGEELNVVPDGANLGLGCGNPQAIAQLTPGEVVVDLGSGGGFDCFLASRQVGESGKVIGVDMTPEMVSRARQNAIKGGFMNVDFRLGEIEHLPVADQSVDVIISNCVINLSPDKEQVYREAYRVLLPGGRLAISDVVTTAELPPEIKNDLEDLYAGCISGASSIPELEQMLVQSGFSNIRILPKDESKTFIKEWIPGIKLEDYIVSAIIQAVKA